MKVRVDLLRVHRLWRPFQMSAAVYRMRVSRPLHRKGGGFLSITCKYRSSRNKI